MIFRAFILTIILTFPLAGQAARIGCADFAKSASGGGSASVRLKKYLDVNWKYLMNEFPEWATYVGYKGLNDRLSDQSISAVERRRTETRCMLKSLQTIPRKGLTGEDRVTYDLAEREMKLSIEGEKFGDDYMPINHMGGFQIDAAGLFMSMPTATAADYDNILARMEALPVLIKQNEELMREGLKRKVTPVKAFLGKIDGQIEALMAAKPEDSPLYEPFKDFRGGVSADEQKRLTEKAKEILKQKVYPALAAFKTFLDKEYIPNAREFIAFTDMPDGKAWYAYMVKRHTTTDKTPEQLHQLGISEVDRLTAEMNKIREKVKFSGDLKAFNKFLLKDKQFYYTKAEDLLAGYRDITKKADAELPKIFRTLPRLTYGVRAIPDFAAPASSGAQYQGGSLEAGRAGWFEANTHDLKSRPKWDMETLAFHEAVPGHHFQIAVAQEIEDLPEFRRHGGFTAFIEGWALYAEGLGDEMGFFKDPYSKFGNLSGEMMRSIRLVVDTGMHAKGWSKQQALDYYRSKMPITDSDSEVEINRYITWPGQALAYKVGQLKFRELREKAKVALGDKFDVRDYHDEVLRHGALPMDVLERTVDEWIASSKKKKSKSKLT